MGFSLYYNFVGVAKVLHLKDKVVILEFILWNKPIKVQKLR